MDTMPTPGTRLRIDGTDCESLNGSTGTALAEGDLVDGIPLGPASIHGYDADSDTFLWVQIDRDETDPVYAFRLSEVTPITDEKPGSICDDCGALMDRDVCDDCGGQ